MLSWVSTGGPVSYEMFGAIPQLMYNNYKKTTPINVELSLDRRAGSLLNVWRNSTIDVL
jgi:hypothetical protein